MALLILLLLLLMLPVHLRDWVRANRWRRLVVGRWHRVADLLGGRRRNRHDELVPVVVVLVQARVWQCHLPAQQEETGGGAEADREAPVGPDGEERMMEGTGGATVAMVAVLRDPMAGAVVRGPMIGMTATTIIMMIGITAPTIMVTMISMTDTTAMMISIPTTIDREETGVAAPAERDMGEGPEVEVQHQDQMKDMVMEDASTHHLTTVVWMNMEDKEEGRRPSQEIGMDVEGPIQVRLTAQSIVMGVMNTAAEVEGRGQTVGGIESFRKIIPMS